MEFFHPLYLVGRGTWHDSSTGKKNNLYLHPLLHASREGDIEDDIYRMKGNMLFEKYML